MRVCNISKGTQLGKDIVLANKFFARLKGLLGRKRLTAGEGILLTPCQGVHGVGMAFSCEAIYLSQAGEVLKIIQLNPNKFGPYLRQAHMVLEVPVGTAEQTHTVTGDLLQWDMNT